VGSLIEESTRVRDFSCPRCGQQLAFENSRCLHCGATLRFVLDTRDFVALVEDGPNPRTAEVGGVVLTSCANLFTARCNWATPAGTSLCPSCTLTRVRPADADTSGISAFADAEAAKRRLVLELVELGLPIVGRAEDPEGGLCFDLLSSEEEPVITGHDNGVVTLDLAESDDVHRTQLQLSMAEPYRTLLGHFRHETGHYYATLFLDGAAAQERAARPEFERLFGDPDADYQAALDRHYSQGAPVGWARSFVSSYATMHPAEDWAETFAHYLHIRDTLDTAAAFGMAPSGAAADRPLAGDVGFDKIIELWLPLSWSLNMVNRSMGHVDLYPFVLPDAVLEKMRLVHHLVTAEGA
jgi:hypothetical protein